MSTFPELYFKNSLAHNIQDVVNFSESNSEKLKELETYYKKKAAIETKYSQDLSKLFTSYQNIFTDGIAPNEKEGSLNAAWSAVCDEELRLAFSHEAYSHAIENSQDSIVNKLHTALETYNSCRKSLTEIIRQQKKQLEDVYTGLKKTKLNYENARSDSEELSQQLEAAQNNYQMQGKVQKLQSKYEAATKKRDQAQQLSIESEELKDKIQHQYYSDHVPTILDKFEMLENWRCQFIKDSLMDSVTAALKLCDQAGKLSCRVAEKVKNINIQTDLDMFVSSKARKPTSVGTDISVMSLLHPDMDGRMEMTNKFQNGVRWKEYHCVLMGAKKKEPYLYIFDSEDAKHARSIIRIMYGPRVVRPTDKSLLYRDYSFQIKTEAGPIFFACRTEDSYNEWMEQLQKVSQGLDEIYDASSERKVQSLKIKYIEAKGLPIQNYFLLTCLDSEYQARSQLKLNTSSPFFGEEFEFDLLPQGFENLVMYVMTSEKHLVTQRINEDSLGYVTIPRSHMAEVMSEEKWIPIKMLAFISEEAPSIRIKFSFSKEVILPLRHYGDLANALWNRDVMSCLDSLIVPAEREKTARTLLSIYRAWGRATDFLKDLSALEVKNTENPKIIFRSNSLATKALDQWMKLIGMDFLYRALRSFCTDVYNMRSGCEVDPTRLTNPNDAKTNFKKLMEVTEKCWHSILHAMKTKPPWEIRTVFRNLQNLACHKFGDDSVAKYTTISGLFFLRFICPAIINPKAFNIVPNDPPAHTARTLTLVAKTIQNLANLVKFGQKEPYMEDMNSFIVANMDKLKEVINEACTIYADDISENPPRIDLPRQMARIHSSLLAVEPNMLKYQEENGTDGVQELLSCLDDLKKPLNERRKTYKDTSRLPDLFGFLPDNTNMTKVLYDFAAEGPGELSVKAGEDAEIVNSNVHGAEGWVSVRVGKHTGFVPSSYISTSPSTITRRGAVNAEVPIGSEAVVPIRSDNHPTKYATESIPSGSTPTALTSIPSPKKIRPKSKSNASNSLLNLTNQNPSPPSSPSRIKDNLKSSSPVFVLPNAPVASSPTPQPISLKPLTPTNSSNSINNTSTASMNSRAASSKGDPNKITLGETFYYEIMSRPDVNKKLENAPDGCFLLRKSTHPTHLYTISLKYEGSIKHFRVKIQENKEYKIIGKMRSFVTVQGLLIHYQTEFLTEKGELLKQQV